MLLEPKMSERDNAFLDGEGRQLASASPNIQQRVAVCLSLLILSSLFLLLSRRCCSCSCEGLPSGGEEGPCSLVTNNIPLCSFFPPIFFFRFRCSLFPKISKNQLLLLCSQHYFPFVPLFPIIFPCSLVGWKPWGSVTC